MACWEMFGYAVSKNDRKITYVAPTYQQARDIAWEELKKICRPLTISAHESRLELTIKTQHGGQSLISLRGWESIETIRGQRNDFLVLDEVAMMRNFWSNWHEVLRPTLTDTKGESLFLSTPQGFNHFYDLFNQQDTDQDYKSFHFTSYDNPHIPAEELDKAKQELTEDRFAQEYLADFRKTQGLIYKEFIRAKHVTHEIPEEGEKFLGIDWGYVHPTVILTLVRDSLGIIYVTDEWVRSGKTTAEACEYAATLGARYSYPDPARPDSNEELSRAGVYVKEVNKDVVKGIDSVRNAFKNGRLLISYTCKNLIAELESYAYKENSEEPIKENDDCVDALRYAIFMQAPARSLFKRDVVRKRPESRRQMVNSVSGY